MSLPHDTIIKEMYFAETPLQLNIIIRDQQRHLLTARAVPSWVCMLEELDLSLVLAQRSLPHISEAKAPEDLKIQTTQYMNR